MVTAELAVALPAVVAVLAVCLWAFGAAVDQVRCVDAARAAARAAARGEAGGSVDALVRREAPAGSSSSVTVSGTDLTVVVLAPERRLAGLVPLGFRAKASATAAREQTGQEP